MRKIGSRRTGGWILTQPPGRAGGGPAQEWPPRGGGGELGLDSLGDDELWPCRPPLDDEDEPRGVTALPEPEPVRGAGAARGVEGVWYVFGVAWVPASRERGVAGAE